MNHMKDPKFKSNILLATYVVVLAFLFINIKSVGGFLGSAIHILKPFLIAICIAFILNIPMKFYEYRVITPLLKKSKNKKAKNAIRPLALILAILSIIVVFIGLITFIIPQLVESGTTLVKSIPEYIQSVQKFMGSYLSSTDVLNEVWSQLAAMGEDLINIVGQITGSLVSQVLDITMGVTSTIVNLFMGTLIAIYILLSKEKLSIQSKKIIYAFLNENFADKIMDLAKISDFKFTKFVSGQCIEAVILGTLCFIGMSIFRMPYALLISTIIGVTALVPIFGALIGTIPSVFIIFMVNPMTAIWFIVLIIVIQQIEGNLIYPMVVGNSIGLSAIWVLFAITVGGSTFGVLGILIGIPLFGVIYTVFSSVTNKRLKEKNIKIEDIDLK